MRDYPHPEDLGLDPQADRTEDLRPGNNDGPSAGTPRPSESTIQQETEKGRSMSTVNPYPVDSATRPCCGGIGGHSHDCRPEPPVPAGATTDGWNTVNSDGILVRSLEWSRHDTERASIGVDGWQDVNGVVTRGISVYGLSEGESLTANEAVKVALALLKAADDLGQLDNPGPQDPPIVDTSRNW